MKVAPPQVYFAEEARASEEFGELVDGKQRIAVWNDRFVDVGEVDADAYGAVRFVCDDHVAHPVGGVDLLEDAVAHHAVNLLFDLRKQSEGYST